MGKLVCDWVDEGKNKDGSPTDRCGKDVKDHVATVHLQLFQVQCEGCGDWFSRRDSLERHKNEGRCSLG
ncbi:uncharacterized protein B0H18DRAFT_1071729 [Fomitopsis serialis]|uniref:uncharacterized protein n=1 Tax=Fomitopsis serialis TaxID=139415 RepID=UPI0020074229|nr:uncharacterized protein B0H18DRAFT_1071729 [Neoantrodia serialis]KAH9910214.1 hypothetical protein B0H18DRAFT_1071729 [Neoantrodia serialis]